MSEINTEQGFTITDGWVIDLSQKVWWRPIDTAPKDGTMVLCFLPTSDVKVRIGRYFNNATSKFGKIVERTEGWAVGMSSTDKAELEPTHWMPIPDPPIPLVVERSHNLRDVG